MEEKKKKGTVRFAVILTVIAVLTIAIMCYFIYYLLNARKTDNEKISDLNNQIKSLHVSINSLNNRVNYIDDEVDSDPEDEDAEYEELTEESYKKYSTENYIVKITKLEKEDDETANIVVRVYSNEDSVDADTYTGTDTYLEATISLDTKVCAYTIDEPTEEQTTTLEEYLSETDQSFRESVEDKLFVEAADRIVFENGEISLLPIAGV